MFFKLINRCMLAILLITCVSCSKPDVAYYKNNLDEAETRLKQCEIDIVAAIRANDKDTIEALQSDKECLAAEVALKEHRKKLAEDAAVERQKLAQEARVRFEKQLSVKKEELSSVELDELIKKKKDCPFTRRNDDPECAAVVMVLKSRTEAEKQRISEDYQGESLVAYSAKLCQGIEFHELKCTLSKDVIKEQRKMTVASYLDDREKLKSTFNECQANYQKLRSDKKRNEARDYSKTWKCSTVLEAAKKIKIRNFSKPIP